jgi:SAM-dependent methyltransferase
MNLRELQLNWDGFGRSRPLWSVLTRDEEWQADEFFATGVKEVDALLKHLERLGVRVSRGRALDFGCGVGRVTQALARHFDEVCGVDLAPSMLDVARQFNRHDGPCSFFLNQTDDLAQFASDSFDLIYSNITLQHMLPRYSRNYIREFVRVLAPAGVLAFQIPSELIDSNALRRTFRKRLAPGVLELYRRVKRGSGKVIDRTRPTGQLNGPRMEMHGIPSEEVVRLLDASGARVLDVRVDRSETANRQWVCFFYYATKDHSECA